MYCIIDKIEDNNGEMKYTPVGYSSDMAVCTQINSDYNSTLGQWISDNLVGLEDGTISVSDFFLSTPFVYKVTEDVSTIDGLNIPQINNVNEL